jgi:hypothetical protein
MRLPHSFCAEKARKPETDRVVVPQLCHPPSMPFKEAEGRDDTALQQRNSGSVAHDKHLLTLRPC